MSTDRCARCGFERKEHTYNGACYGLCGEFIEEQVYPHEQPLPDNVFIHPSRSTADIPVVDVLRGAYRADFVELVVVGVTKDGREQVLASRSDASSSMYLCQRALHVMHQHMDNVQQEIRDALGLDDDSPTPAA